MCMNRMAGSFIKRWKRYPLSCKGSWERVIYRARPYGMWAIHGGIANGIAGPAAGAEYRHQDGLLCQEGRSFCSTGFARCSLQGGIPSRLMIVSVISFRFKTTGAFSTAFWLISVCFGKTETGMGDRIQSENDVNGVPVIGGHLVSR